MDVFFVISGFVITDSLLRQWSALGRLDLRSFYVRRIRRLLPALSLVLCATCVASALLEPPNGQQQTTAQTALGAMTLSANIAIPRLALDYFAPLASANPLLHTWSLSAEEQFYLAFPTLLLVGLTVTRRASALRGASVIVAVVSVASFALLVWTTYSARLDGSAGIALDPFYSSLTRAWEFGAGALIVLTAPTLCRGSRGVLLLSGIAGFAMVVLSALIITSTTTFPGLAVLLPTTGTVLMLASGLHGENFLSRTFGVRPLVTLGNLSYSWYLWHWPVIAFGRLLAPAVEWMPLACAATSLAPAYLSYRFVENPVRFSTRLKGGALAAVLTATIVLPITMAASLGLGARRGWGQDWALGNHVVLQRGCDTGSFDPVRCRWRVSGAAGSVLLLGDSQSWAIADGLIPAAADLGLETIVGSHNGCPFLSLDGPSVGSGVRQVCGPHNEARLRFAEDHPPAIAVVANMSFLEYLPASEEWWRGGLAEAVRRLEAAGVRIVLVTVAPFGDESSERLSFLVKPAGDRYTALDAHLSRQRAARGVELQIADEHPFVITFDPASVLCDLRRCTVARGGVQLYSDRNHLSRPGALLLRDGLRDALKRALVHHE